MIVDRGGSRPDPLDRLAGGVPARLAWGAALALLLSWLIVSLRFPPGRDQGVFLWIGDVVNAGGAPYRDAWETKGPLVFALSAVVRRAFGATTWGIRLFDAGVVIGTLALIVALLRRAGASGAAPWAAVVFAVAYARLGWWDSAQPETWATACLTVALLLAWPPGGAAAGERTPLRRLLLAGFLTGCAALVKPFFVLFLVVPALVAGGDGRVRARVVVLLGAGSLAALLLALAWMGSLGSDVITAFVDTHVRFNATVYASAGGSSWGQRFTRMAGDMAGGTLLPAMLMALPSARARGTDERRLARACALWLALALGLVLWQGKFWPYQWTPAYPPLAILAGMGARSFEIEARRRAFEKLFAAGCALLLASQTIEPARWVAAWVRDTIVSPDAKRWYAHFGKYDLARGTFPLIARHLRDTVSPGERVVVWGMEPVIYALSGRASASRYGVHLPLVLGGDTRARRAARARFVADLAARPPSAIVVLENDRNQLVRRDSRQLLDEVPELAELLARAYRPGAVFPDARVYDRISR